jgi:hypothetical protein
MRKRSTPSAPIKSTPMMLSAGSARWIEQPALAQRLRERIHRVLNWATAKGLRDGKRLIFAEQLGCRAPRRQREIASRCVAFPEPIEPMPTQHFPDGELIAILLH